MSSRSVLVFEPLAGDSTWARHPNTLLALGPRTYLEIVAPDPNQPEPAAPRPYGVDGVTRAGLVGWALTRDDIERQSVRLALRASTRAT